MRSNAPLHARKKLPAGRAKFEMVRGFDAKRTRGRVARGRETSGRRPRNRGIPGRIKNKRPRRDGERPHSTPSPHVYTNNNLRHQPAHVLVVDLLQDFPSI